MTPRLDDIAEFVRVAEAGSFAGVARRTGVTPSTIGRRISRLEAAVGLPLLSRTTRKLRLTPDGEAYFERCRSALDGLEEAEAALIRSREEPTGTLRLDAPLGFGRAFLAPRLARWLPRHPGLKVALTLRDQSIDPQAEGVDVAVRLGALADSALHARRVGECRLVACASKAYLRRHGTPRRVHDLSRHSCISHLRAGRVEPWGLGGPGLERRQAVDGPFAADDAGAMLEAALAGLGVVMMFDFMVVEHLRAGALALVLVDDMPAPWPIHALYPKNRHLLPRVRVFLEFLADQLRR